MTDTNIGSSPFIGKIKKTAMALLAVGGLGLIGSYALNGPERFFADYLIGFWFFAGISVTMLFFAALQFLTRSGWSASIRRIAENLTGMIPFMLLFAAPLIINTYMGHHSIYEWSHEEAANDVILQSKAAYLNPLAFAIRMVVYCALWLWMLQFVVGNSVKQDTAGKDIRPTRKNWKRAAPWVLVYALSITFAAFDLLMSLEPHWFSTIWGVYSFAGHFVAALAILTLFIIGLHNNILLKGYIRDEHFHDLGKLMFAFSVFWAYIGFSQYFIIWYANLPEETIYYTYRMEGVWGPFGYALMILRFVLPFALLLRQDVKRKKVFLIAGSCVILLAHFVDITWIVMPAVTKVAGWEGLAFSWQEFTGVIFFAGVFLFLATQLFQKRSAVAINDPLLQESFEYHS
jgi:hypothetical protein